MAVNAIAGSIDFESVVLAKPECTFTMVSPRGVIACAVVRPTFRDRDRVRESDAALNLTTYRHLTGARRGAISLPTDAFLTATLQKRGGATICSCLKHGLGSWLSLIDQSMKRHACDY
jgi:hypothetical protein